MSVVYAGTGTLALDERDDYPEPMARRLDTGQWGVIWSDPAAFGWYPVHPANQPDPDHVRSVIWNDAQGRFDETWTFDQATADANAAAAAKQAMADQVANQVTILRGWAVDADNAVAAWDGWTDGQKDTALKTVIQRLGRFFDAFADDHESR